MTIHLIVGLTGAILCGVLLRVGFNRNITSDFWFNMTWAGLVGFIFFLILAIWPFLSRCDYKEFEIKYEMVEEFRQNEPETANNFIYVMDILEINQELAEYQASKQFWGLWSCLPDSVMDLAPIGLGG